MTLYLLPKTMIYCLFWTIVIETIIAYLLGIKNKTNILIIILVQVMTNPLVVSLTIASYLYYGIKVKYIVEIILEISVLLFEGIIYKKELINNKINPYLLSLLLNASSYLLGYLL